MTAQNQHYVPKFILRQFLFDEANERVSVYDKHTDNTFVTSIKNVMAERRFNDFSYEEWIVSFEDIATGIEQMVLPRYRNIVETRRLEGTPEERADLGFLIAFQLTRTKASRELWSDLQHALRKKVEALGGKMEDIDGWEPMTEDRLKMEHLTSIRDTIPKFAQIIAQKDFLLAESALGRGFYLGDHPVCLNNARNFGPYGNLGLGVLGIEIYLPLTSDLMLCAFCPSILRESRKRLDAARQIRVDAVGALMAGKITAPEMKKMLGELARGCTPASDTLRFFEERRPIPSDEANMDFYNSLQMAFAHRYVISKHADFQLAMKHNNEFPALRKGKRVSFD